jgi:hypothetical protein
LFERIFILFCKSKFNDLFENSTFLCKSMFLLMNHFIIFLMVRFIWEFHVWLMAWFIFSLLLNFLACDVFSISLHSWLVNFHCW